MCVCSQVKNFTKPRSGQLRLLNVDSISVCRSVPCFNVESLLLRYLEAMLNKFFDSIIPSLKTSKIQKWLPGRPKMADGSG